MNKAALGIAAVVVVLCIVGTVTVYAMGNILEDREPYPEYTVTGTGPGGTSCNGTVTCTDTGESSTRPVLRFAFSISLSDGTIDSFDEYLMLDENGQPDSSLYTREDDPSGAMWRSVSNTGLVFIVTDGTVTGILYASDGYDLTAQATP